MAARLARDPLVFDKLGPAISKPVMLDWPVPLVGTSTVAGSLLRVESPYGNVWTDIDAAAVKRSGLTEGLILAINFGGRVLTVPFVATFGDVPESAPLAYINSRGLLSFALNMGNFAGKYAARAGETVTVSVSSAAFAADGR